MKLELRYPVTPENAVEHAQLAVEAVWDGFERDLDYSPGSLELLDQHVESLREDGFTAEDVAELLFAFGCYTGEVLRRALGGRWLPTARSALQQLSPWPLVLLLPDGSTWDPIGKLYKRFELGDGEYLPAFLAAAAAGRRAP